MTVFDMQAPTTDLPGPRTRVGQWAVILGASSGMGRAVAQQLADDGMNIYGVHFDTASRDGEILDQIVTLRESGSTIVFRNANAAAEPTRADTVAELVDLLAAGDPDRGVGVVFHSLAFGSLLPYLPLPDASQTDLLSPKQMTMTVEVMAHSLVWWTRDLLRGGLLRPGSQIMAMTSAGDSRVTRSYGAVSAAKSALISHVRQLAVELAPYRVGVNAIRAGVTLTPSFQRIPGSANIQRLALAANPHGRLTRPEDVAEAVATLSASASSWLTGNVIAVDGGEGLTT